MSRTIVLLDAGQIPPSAIDADLNKLTLFWSNLPTVIYIRKT